MHTSRMKLAVTLALALLFVVVLSAFAAPEANPQRFNIRQTNVTIPWWFPPPEGLNGNVCSGVPLGYEVNPVDNTSNRTKRALVQDLRNGRKQIKVWDQIRGTATDNYGNVYKFQYQNNVTVDFNGTVATVTMTDYFRLNGKPFTHKLGFKFVWKYYADDISLVQVMDGGQLVDMYPDFIWPTDDGVTETTNPDFVPGSWIIRYDYGDWFNCDPL